LDRGVDVALADRFFRAQIAASKEVQAADLARLEHGEGVAAAATADLAAMRPKLDAMAATLLDDLERFARAAARRDAAPLPTLAAALAASPAPGDVPPGVRARALAPLGLPSPAPSAADAADADAAAPDAAPNR